MSNMRPRRARTTSRVLVFGSRPEINITRSPRWVLLAGRFHAAAALLFWSTISFTTTPSRPLCSSRTTTPSRPLCSSRTTFLTPPEQRPPPDRAVVLVAAFPSYRRRLPLRPVSEATGGLNNASTVSIEAQLSELHGTSGSSTTSTGSTATSSPYYRWCPTLGHVTCNGYPLESLQDLQGVQQLLGRRGDHAALSADSTNTVSQSGGAASSTNKIPHQFHLNVFGHDFLTVGKLRWTKALCDLDSDGDGFSNGFELGDPCCQGQVQVGESVPLSHPGIGSDRPSLVLQTAVAEVQCGVFPAGTTGGNGNQTENGVAATRNNITTQTATILFQSTKESLDDVILKHGAVLPSVLAGTTAEDDVSITAARDRIRTMYLNYGVNLYLPVAMAIAPAEINDTWNNATAVEDADEDASRSGNTPAGKNNIFKLVGADTAFQTLVLKLTNQALTIPAGGAGGSASSPARTFGLVTLKNGTNSSNEIFSTGGEQDTRLIKILPKDYQFDWNFVLYHTEFLQYLEKLQQQEQAEARAEADSNNSDQNNSTTLTTRSMVTGFNIEFQNPENLHHLDIFCNSYRLPQPEVELVWNTSDQTLQFVTAGMIFNEEKSSADKSGNTNSTITSNSGATSVLKGIPATPPVLLYSERPQALPSAAPVLEFHDAYRFNWTKTVASFTPGGPGMVYRKNAAAVHLDLETSCKSLFVNLHYVRRSSGAAAFSATTLQGGTMTSTPPPSSNSMTNHSTTPASGMIAGSGPSSSYSQELHWLQQLKPGDGFRMTIETTTTRRASVDDVAPLVPAPLNQTTATPAAQGSSTISPEQQQRSEEDIGMFSPLLLKNDPRATLKKVNPRGGAGDEQNNDQRRRKNRGYFLSKTCKIQLTCGGGHSGGVVSSGNNATANSCPFKLQWVNYHGHYTSSEMYARRIRPMEPAAAPRTTTTVGTARSNANAGTRTSTSSQSQTQITQESFTYTDLLSMPWFNFNDQAYLPNFLSKDTAATTTSLLASTNASLTSNTTSTRTTSSSEVSIEIKDGDIIQAVCVWDTRLGYNFAQSAANATATLEQTQQNLLPFGFQEGAEMCIHLWLYTPRSTAVTCEPIENVHATSSTVGTALSPLTLPPTSLKNQDLYLFGELPARRWPRDMA
ncbi:unnamed protein product [Amoebophrya sp. A120]|nr:unnamed protein product [Amoebophrya sp. A120]|eukprot:GSA120T00013664001.1